MYHRTICVLIEMHRVTVRKNLNRNVNGESNTCLNLTCIIAVAVAPYAFQVDTLLDRCLKVYTTLWNIWTYQLLCKKI